MLKGNLIYERELQQTAFRRKIIVALMNSPKPVFSTLNHYSRKETHAGDPTILHQDTASHLMCVFQGEYSYLLLDTRGNPRKMKVNFIASN